jgi:type I restriction enzyme M protein
MLKHFEDFFRLLPTRADSEFSWTVDMDERKRVAANEARPFKEQATAKSQQAAQWSQRIVDLKNAFPCDDQAIEEAEAKVKELTRESRDLTAKAKDIGDAVYDLKAVNPHRQPVVDMRTPEELIGIIEAKGQEIAEALALLRNHDFATEPTTIDHTKTSVLPQYLTG